MTDNILSYNFGNDYNQIMTYNSIWEDIKTLLNSNQSLNITQLLFIIIHLIIRSANKNFDEFYIMLDNQTIIFDIF